MLLLTIGLVEVLWDESCEVSCAFEDNLLWGESFTTSGNSWLDTQHLVDDQVRLLLLIGDVGILVESEDLWSLLLWKLIDVVSVGLCNSIGWSLILASL